MAFLVGEQIVLSVAGGGALPGYYTVDVSGNLVLRGIAPGDYIGTKADGSQFTFNVAGQAEETIVTAPSSGQTPATETIGLEGGTTPADPNTPNLLPADANAAGLPGEADPMSQQPAIEPTYQI